MFNSITKIAYDAEDRKGLIVEAFGATEQRTSGVILYDKVGTPLQVRDGNNRIHTIEYNALNLPWKSYDPAPFNSQFAEMAYYKTGKVKDVTNRRGKKTTTEYDPLWRVTLVTDPLTQTVKTTYDYVGNVRTVKDKRDIISETLYDDLHRPREKSRAGMRLFTYEYDNNGNLTAEIDAEQKRTEYSYTPRNLKDKALYADTTFRSYSYDGNGNLKTETDEETIDTSYGYDRENRLTASERAGELTQKSYTPLGDLLAVIHPEGNSRLNQYDKLRRLIKVTDDPWGPALATDYEYDANNNLTKRTDARRKVVDQTYDELNRMSSRIQRKSSGDLVTSFDLYDAEGNLIDLTDPKGQKQHHTYDDLNRRTESRYTDTAGATLTVTTGYDGNNNITASSSPSDSTSNLYDNFDRLQSSTQRGTTIGYTYFDSGNRKSVTVNGNSTSYLYDDRNRVKTATAGSLVTSFDYYKDGKKKTVSYPNGAKEEYEYFPSNRVQTLTNSLNSAVISKFDYNYDRNGNRKSQVETRGARTINTSYDYDTLDRMTNYSVTESSATTKTDYIFDGYNRQTETVTKPDASPTTKTYSYDDTDWLTQIVDGTKTIGYSYDNNGNTQQKTDSTDAANPTIFEYDARDKLTRTTKGATILGSYSYNANGYRVRQDNSDRGNVDYLYDGTAVIEERNAGGLLAHYRYAGKLYSLFDGTSSQYYHQDALGSTTDLTDDAGTTKASYFLNPWGMIVDSIGQSVNRRVFTGKEIDQNTGLIYFGARYYDPDTARFTTQDSYLGEQGIPPSLHRYLYAYSNPTVFIDLEGYVGIFFDGTGMDKDKDNIPQTNIAKLYDAYSDSKPLYYEGVGSNWYTKYSLGGFSGTGGKNRVERAYIDLVNEYNEAKEEDRHIDIFGFSRGASLARDLASKIRNEGIEDRSRQIGTRRVRDYDAENAIGDDVIRYKDVPEYKKFENTSIRFMGLFDTVGSFGIPGNGVDIGYDLSVDNNFVKQTRHAVATDEYRGLFGLQSILREKGASLPSNMVEKKFRGAHSDVGGGYSNDENGKSNAISRIPLNWMYNEAKKSGVKFESLDSTDRQIPDINKIPEAQLKEKYIHDSRYAWERWRNKKDRDVYYPNRKFSNVETSITKEDRKGTFDGVILGVSY